LKNPLFYNYCNDKRTVRLKTRTYLIFCVKPSVVHGTLTPTRTPKTITTKVDFGCLAKCIYFLELIMDLFDLTTRQEQPAEFPL
jgi:hypothetical protein